MEKNKKPFIGLYLLAATLIFSAGIAAGQFVDVNLSSIRRGSVSVGNDDLNYETVEEAYDTLRNSYDGELDKSKLVDGLKKGLAEATGDPYTEYLSSEESKEFQQSLSGTFTGIGAELGKENNAIVVVAPLRGFPAEKAGLKAKDIILKIDDEDALSMSINDAVKRIRGEKGTIVKLSVLRGSEQLEISIERADIKVPSVDYQILEGNIGYVQISRFSDDTDGLIRDAARDFKSKNVQKIIVDLRNNPGGYLEQSIKVASHWLDSGQVVVSEKRGGLVMRTHKAIAGQEFKGMQTVVLINEGSASASEILAGALKDYGLATLVGQKTYGKGSVQEVDTLSGGASLKITIARWFTPKDKNIDKEGIEPDHKVEITAEQVTAGQDPQKQKAVELLQ